MDSGGSGKLDDKKNASHTLSMLRKKAFTYEKKEKGI